MNLLDLNRDELLELAVKQAAELDQLRPKPPKFRKGQVVYFGQQGRFFKIARVKMENGRYLYTYRAQDAAHVVPNAYWFYENTIVALSAIDINGEEDPDAPSAG